MCFMIYVFMLVIPGGCCAALYIRSLLMNETIIAFLFFQLATLLLGAARRSVLAVMTAIERGMRVVAGGGVR